MRAANPRAGSFVGASYKRKELFACNWRPRNYRLVDSPLAYRIRSTDHPTDLRAKERLLAVYATGSSGQLLKTRFWRE